MFVAVGDLENAFYRLAVPPGMDHLFTLPAVDSGLVGLTRLDGTPLAAGERLLPCLQILPMGWNWAMHICQAVVRHAVVQAGFADDDLLEDGAPALRLDAHDAVVPAAYVDNFFAFSRDPAAARRRRDDISRVLRGWGLKVHEETDSTGGASFLGLELFKGRLLSIKRKRLWRLRWGLETLLRKGQCSSAVMQVVAGHITWALLLRRESLSILDKTYAYIFSSQPAGAPLWPAVRRELWTIRSILPLICADLSAPWCPTLSCSDASEFGLGVCTRPLQPDLVSSFGGFAEHGDIKSMGAAGPEQSHSPHIP